MPLDNNILSNIIKIINDSKNSYQGAEVKELKKIAELINIKLPNLKEKEKSDILYIKIFSYIEYILGENTEKEFYKKLKPFFIKFISDNEFKKQKYYEGIESENKYLYLFDILPSIQNFDNEKEKILKLIINDISYDEDEIVKIVISFNNDELKEKYLKYFSEKSKIAKILISIQNDETKLRLLYFYKSIGKEFKTNIENQIVASLKDDKYKIEYLDANEEKSFDVIVSLKDDNNKLKYYNSMDVNEQINLIASLKDNNIKCNFLPILSKLNVSLTEIIETINDDNLILYSFNYIKNNREIIIGLKNLKDKNNILKALPIIKNSYVYRYIRKNKLISNEEIINNIDLFLSVECEKTIEPKEKKEIIKKLYNTNNDIVNTLNFKLLEDKYIRNLGLETINIIGSFDELQEKLLNLNDKQYEVFYKIINYYINKKTVDWRLVANQLLSEFSMKEYSHCNKLIEEMKSVESNKIDVLIKIILNGNKYRIKADEIDNYDLIVKNICDKQINSDNILEQKDAIMQKLFGIGRDLNMLRNFAGIARRDAVWINELYGGDIEYIEDSVYKNIVKTIKDVYSIQDQKKLKEYYNSIEKFCYIDIFELETELKKAYLKLYNKTLLNINTLQKNEDGLYEAGLDFCIITTSIGAYVENSPENYKKDWNRASLISQHFCTNYIRNDMLGTAPIPHILYGFSQMDEDSLLLSGPNDIYSSGASFISKAYEHEKYCSPETFINETHLSKFKYNEMDFKRIQKGIKKQPDYILVFKKDNIISNIEEAKKVSSQWGGLPIIFIDVNKCLKNERKKLDELILKYKENNSIQILKEIIQKIVNNRITDKSFAKEIDINKLLNYSNAEIDNELLSKIDNMRKL